MPMQPQSQPDPAKHGNRHRPRPTTCLSPEALTTIGTGIALASLNVGFITWLRLDMKTDQAEAAAPAPATEPPCRVQGEYSRIYIRSHFRTARGLDRAAIASVRVAERGGRHGDVVSSHTLMYRSGSEGRIGEGR